MPRSPRRLNGETETEREREALALPSFARRVRKMREAAGEERKPVIELCSRASFSQHGAHDGLEDSALALLARSCASAALPLRRG